MPQSNYTRLMGGKDSERKRRKEKKEKEKGEREKLKKGTIVESAVHHKYKIVCFLGSGAFGDVYKVEKDNGQMYAMKTEPITKDDKKADESDRQSSRFKMEVRIMSECSKISDPSRKKHFVPLEDHGRANSLKYVIMGLVGQSLFDIRMDLNERDQENFSKETALLCAMQTFQSVWDLHSVGFLHRDIKAHNFCIGLEPKQTTVYMLDFGVSKKFIDKDGRIKRQKGRGKFVGTLRFAPKNSHRLKDLGRQDDLETWFYMVLDFYNTHLLPWRGQMDRDTVLEMKMDLFKGAYDSKLYSTIPKDFRKIAVYIDSLDYNDTPDYLAITERMKLIAGDEKVDQNTVLDWCKPRKKKNSKEPKKERKKESDEENGETEDSGEDSTESSGDEKGKEKKRRSKNSKKRNRKDKEKRLSKENAKGSKETLESKESRMDSPVKPMKNSRENGDKRRKA